MRMFLLTVMLFMFPFNAQAQDIKFCDALKLDETYKKNNSYKKLLQGDDGWIFRTKSDFNQDFKVNSALKERFKRLDKAFQDQGIKLVIALLPTRGLMHQDKINYPDYNFEEAKSSYLKLVKKLEEINIPVASITDFSATPNFFYKQDHHWSAEGAKVIAKGVAEKIKALPEYVEIPKVSYKTESTEKVEHKGTFAGFVNKVCSTDLKNEIVPFYKTYESEQSNDLFDDKPLAEIVLLGTSNSDQKASHSNFDGFLKEYVGADVRNLSVSGGGVDTSMLDWFSSTDYKSSKPKIVVWEIPVYQNFKGGPFYRQSIPAVYGGCSGNVIATDEVVIKNGRFRILEKLAEMNISAKGHYVELKFSDFKGRKFRLTNNYKNGDKDPFDFRRSKFYQPDGVFYLEFDQKSEKALAFIDVLMPEGTTGKVTASICPYPAQ